MSRLLRRRNACVIALAVALAGSMSLGGCGTPQAGGKGAHPGRTGSPGVAAARPAPVAAPAPSRFFADTLLDAVGAGPLEVRESGTGALVAHRKYGANGLAAVGQRRFVLALRDGDACATRLYRFRLNDRGQPGRLSPLGGELHGEMFSLAASANGQVVGYAIGGCVKGDQGHLAVVHLNSGRTRQWGSVNLGGISQGNVALSGGLSMSADGRLLAFTGWDAAGNWHEAGEGRTTSQVVRVLPTNAPAGTLAERSRVVLTRAVRSPELQAAVLSPGGASFYLCAVSGGRAERLTRIAMYHTATGRLRVAIAALRGIPFPGCPVALDSTGHFLLVPYSLRQPRRPAGRPVLLVARINLNTPDLRDLTGGNLTMSSGCPSGAKWCTSAP